MPANEQRYYDALRRITRYMLPDKLKRMAETTYGVSPEEAVEMAYENVLTEARDAIRGRRRPGPGLKARTLDPRPSEEQDAGTQS